MYYFIVLYLYFYFLCLFLSFFYYSYLCLYIFYSLHYFIFLYNLFFVTFQGLTAAIMKITVFWDVVPCSLVEIDRRFRGTYCLHHQSNHCPSTLSAPVLSKAIRTLLYVTLPRRPNTHRDVSVRMCSTAPGSRFIRKVAALCKVRIHQPVTHNQWHCHWRHLEELVLRNCVKSKQ
jgi:hypothetical protein